jgi:hypothetical protein
VLDIAGVHHFPILAQSLGGQNQIHTASPGCSFAPKMGPVSLPISDGEDRALARGAGYVIHNNADILLSYQVEGCRGDGEALICVANYRSDFRDRGGPARLSAIPMRP